MRESQTDISMGRAALIQLMSKAINVLLELLISIVLARLLMPSEFGLIAVISVFTGFFSIMSDFGISAAIVQYKDIDKTDCESLLFFCLILGIVMAAGFCGISYAISRIYANDIYISLGFVLALSVIFNSLNMVPNGLLLRGKQFKTIALRSILSNIAAGTLAIILAFNNFSVFSLAIQSVFLSFFILTWNMVTIQVSFKFANFIPVLKRIYKFSGFQYGHQIISYFSSSIDTLLVGKYFGATDLGYYNKAVGLSMIPINYIASPVVSSMQPFLSDHQNDLCEMYHACIKIIRVVFILTVPCGLLLSLSSNEVIIILFGENWLPAIPILQILSIAIAFRAIIWVLGTILISAAKTNLLMLSTIVNAIFIFIASVIGICFGGIVFTSFCIALAYFLELVFCSYICIRVCLKQSILKFIITLLPIALSGLGAFGITYMICNILSLPLFIILCLKLAVFCLCYGGLCILLKQGSYIKEAIKSIKN